MISIASEQSVKNSDLITRLNNYLWQQADTTLFQHILRIVVSLGYDLLFSRLTLWAGSLVYTTLLSLVPLLAVSFSLLKVFGIHNQLQPLLQEFLIPLGPQGEMISDNVIAFVDRIDVSVLGTVGIAILFITAILTISKIEDAFNEQWQIKTSRPWIQRGSYYLSMLMLIPLLAFSGIGMADRLLNSEIIITLFGQQLLGNASSLISIFIPVTITIAIFSLVYTLLPNTAVRFRYALISAVMTTAAWKLCGALFAAFIGEASQYDAIYSSFAILIVFLLWLYLSWLIFLIGARLCMYLQQHQQLLPHENDKNIDSEALAMAIMHEVGRYFLDSKRGPTLNELSLALQTNDEQIRPFIQQLQHAELLCVLKKQRFTPCRSLDKIALSEIIVATRKNATMTKSTPVHPILKQHRKQYQEQLQQSLQQISLRQWLDNSPVNKKQ